MTPQVALKACQQLKVINQLGRLLSQYKWYELQAHFQYTVIKFPRIIMNLNSTETLLKWLQAPALCFEHFFFSQNNCSQSFLVLFQTKKWFGDNIWMTHLNINQVQNERAIFPISNQHLATRRACAFSAHYFEECKAGVSNSSAFKERFQKAPF